MEDPVSTSLRWILVLYIKITGGIISLVKMHSNGYGIQVVTSEEQFRAEGKKLAAHLAEPDVEVVFVYLCMEYGFVCFSFSITLDYI
jgi:hypothetical protein